MESVELFLGDVPQFQVVEGPVDLGAITLHGADIREVHHLRDRDPVLLDTVQDRLVQLQLNQSLQEVVFLGPHVHTVEDPQEIALGDTVTWPQLAVFRLSGLAGVIPDLGQVHHSGRSEASADAGKAGGIEGGGTGKHERPHRLRQPRDRDRVVLALADSQGGADFLRDLQSMGLPRDQRDARKGGSVLSLFGFLGGRQEVQRDAGKVAVEPPSGGTRTTVRRITTTVFCPKPILRGAGLASGVDAPVVWSVMRWPSPWAISNASCLSLRFILRPRDRWSSPLRFVAGCVNLRAQPA